MFIADMVLQMGSFFVEQGAAMDRQMFGGGFTIPAASLAIFNTLGIILLIPIYDRGLVPLLRVFGKKLTHLQRIGTALCLERGPHEVSVRGKWLGQEEF